MTVPLHHFSEDTTCALQLATSILPCDAYHHYYHYQSSAQYLWLAETLYTMGENEEAVTACNKAIFQDHFNQEAIKGRTGRIYPLAYIKHPISDAEFCASVGKSPSEPTLIHDKAVDCYFLQDYMGTLSLIKNNTEHSNSRFLAGKCWVALENYDNALSEFTEAIRLSHIDHDEYHRSASSEHLGRGKKFFANGNIDLAITDFTKAIDLCKSNNDARKARAMAYKLKGNLKMAQEDENASY